MTRHIATVMLVVVLAAVGQASSHTEQTPSAPTLRVYVGKDTYPKTWEQRGTGSLSIFIRPPRDEGTAPLIGYRWVVRQLHTGRASKSGLLDTDDNFHFVDLDGLEPGVYWVSVSAFNKHGEGLATGETVTVPARGYRHPKLQAALDLFVGQHFGSLYQQAAEGTDPSWLFIYTAGGASPLVAWSKIQETSMVFDDIESLVSYSSTDNAIRVRVDFADEKLEALAALLAYPLVHVYYHDRDPFESVVECLDAQEHAMTESAAVWRRFSYLQAQTALERYLAEVFRLWQTETLRDHVEEIYPDRCAAFG